MGTLNTTLNQTSLLSTCQQYHVAWKVELSHMRWELSEDFKKWDIPKWERPLRWGAFEAAKFILAHIPEKQAARAPGAQKTHPVTCWNGTRLHAVTKIHTSQDQDGNYSPSINFLPLLLEAFFDLLIQVNDCDGKSVIKKPDSYMEHRARFGLKCFI